MPTWQFTHLIAYSWPAIKWLLIFIVNVPKWTVNVVGKLSAVFMWGNVLECKILEIKSGSCSTAKQNSTHANGSTHANSVTGPQIEITQELQLICLQRSISPQPKRGVAIIKEDMLLVPLKWQENHLKLLQSEDDLNIFIARIFL